jgi:hypothetical protein
MKVVADEAKSKLKSQLNMYNDDIVAFMRGGGREAINEYRDSILNSDEAQIIRNNHQSLLKYMDQMDDDPTLISDRDLENYHQWKTGNVDAFIYTGAYLKLEDPTEKDLVNADGNVAIAYLNKNYDAVLHNYLRDTGIEYGADGRNKKEYYDDLLMYQWNKLGDPEIERAKDMLRDVNAGKSSTSSTVQSIFDSINGNVKGEFDPTVNEQGQLVSGFWYHEENSAALKNLEQILGAQRYDHTDGGGNKQLYGRRLLVGQELDIAKEFFPNMENGVVSFEDLEAMQENIGTTPIYNEYGELLSPGEHEHNDVVWNDDWTVHGLELMFRVKHYGETKLLTKDDLSDNPDMRDREKTPVLVMSFKEGDIGGKQYDDFRYMELNLNAPMVSKKIDKVLGELTYGAKMSVKDRTVGAPYKFEKGKKFKWTPENINGLVNSMDPYASEVFTRHNHTEYDIDALSILTATAMLDNDKANPYTILEELAKSQDKEELQLIDALKKSDYDGYYDLLQTFGATERDIRRLIDSAARIKMGYYTSHSERVQN